MVGGFALVIGAIVTQGDFFIFLSLSSLVIVLGGAISSSIVNYSLEAVKNTFTHLLNALNQEEADLRTDIELMNMFARKARREGLLTLERDIAEIEEPFLRTGLQYILDGVEKEPLLNILSDQLKSTERKLDQSAKILASMGEYSPAFGMIGTVIGLILMLQNIQNPEALGAGLAVALLTTLYGTIFANMIFLPLSGKIKHVGKKSIIRKEMFHSAIISLIDEENPRIMENKMLNFVEPGKRAEYLAYFQNETFNTKREEQLYANWQEFQFKPWQNLKMHLGTG